MSNAAHGASPIKTLRFTLRPGASATITQLAAALGGRARARAARISVAGFFFPYAPGFPLLACPGRKAIPPAYAARSARRAPVFRP
jgi:hypothetical protein